MRAFVALDLPPGAEAPLVHLQERLPLGRATDPDTFHVTLAFLGEEVDDETLGMVHDGLAALRLPPVPVAVTGLGTLGSASPAILMAEVALTSELETLQARVASCARRAGLTLERRRFRPHVTLARFRHRVAGADLERLRRFLEAEARFRLEPVPVTSFALYASTLTKAGPVHEELARYRLGGL
ncbi:RNA 2',3'-cyclic phosphodiesterase [Histidinibacterium lentulum]|uniref:RNA 2',3'-cyclic phosphodiesterase n=1 Tax=Histidinibacterium lentulum TaxID=2480588 RepID=A0A3N2QL01_9RHOB|nr:RNA 2',3'-cyclic phosphodiesterase [Histidinibacterium lentulum]ROT95853.1 RNA 2',3'-cyclic phosphodiesterase [Histidinibacterium lentulum]